MAIDHFEMGEDVTLKAEFRTPKDEIPPNTLTDPAIVTLTVKKPDNTVVSLSYGVDASVVKVSTGVYKYVLVLDKEGTYHWRWRGVNGVASAGVFSGQLDSVREPNF